MSIMADNRVDSAFDDAAFRKQFPFVLTATNLTGAYVHAPLPDTFDPTTATPQALEQNGIYWPRPAADAPAAVKHAWNAVFGRKWLQKNAIVPTLVPQPGKTHQLRQLKKNPNNNATGTWAGGVIDTGTWASVLGVWTVPTVSQPPQPDANNMGGWDSSSWIGIDGYGDNDVLQAGVEQSFDTPGTGGAQYTPWYEWYVQNAPNNAPGYVYQANISNFQVKAGDVVCCAVQYVNVNSMQSTTPSGWIFYGNATTGQHFTITLAPPPGANFAGSSAEWIMEEPDGGFPNASLVAFTPVVFQTAMAAGPSNAVGNPDQGISVNIATPTGQVITNTTLGNFEVTITDAPFPHVGLASGLTAQLTKAAESRVYFADGQDNLMEWAWDGANVGWVENATGGVTASGSVLTSLYIDGVGSRVYYIGKNLHLTEAAWNGSSWQINDTGLVPTVGSPLCCLYINNSSSRVYYLDSRNHVIEARPASPTWATIDTGGVAARGSALACLDAGGNDASRVYFVGANNGQIQEAAPSGSKWNINPTQSSAIPALGSALTCVYVGNVGKSNGSRVYYLDSSNNINELAFTNGGWNVTDTHITAAGGSALSCLYTGGGSRVYYVDNVAQVNECAWMTNHFVSNSTPARSVIGKPLACVYINNPNSGSRVYYLTSDMTLHELAVVSGNWKTT